MIYIYISIFTFTFHDLYLHFMQLCCSASWIVKLSNSPIKVGRQILTPDWLPCASSQDKSIPDNGVRASEHIPIHWVALLRWFRYSIKLNFPAFSVLLTVNPIHWQRHDKMSKSCPELLREAANLIEEALSRTLPAPPAQLQQTPAASLRTPVQKFMKMLNFFYSGALLQTKAMDQTRLASAPPTDFDGRVWQ